LKDEKGKQRVERTERLEWSRFLAWQLMGC
jgi:hypothetical protein